MPWAFWNVEENPDEPEWQTPTPEQEQDFFDQTDHCETVNVNEDNEDNEDTDDD